jgi:hypothetical protein
LLPWAHANGAPEACEEDTVVTIADILL